MYVCMKSACMCMHMHMYVLLWGGLNNTKVFIWPGEHMEVRRTFRFQASLSICLKSCNLWFANALSKLPVHWAYGDFSDLWLSSHRNSSRDCVSIVSYALLESRDMNSSYHACKVGTLSTELSPQLAIFKMVKLKLT